MNQLPNDTNTPDMTENVSEPKTLRIKLENLNFEYKTTEKKIDSIKDYVFKLVRGKLKYGAIKILSDINMEIYDGECIGIIGRNGMGKTTLLKVISGILEPTSGSIYTNGNMISLLKLGAGFDMDADGIENIYLNGATMGYSRKEMNERMTDILEFANLKDAIRSPLKTYSNGMMSALGFAIAVTLQPEILIVDEVLSVGDAAFSEKCRAKIDEIKDNGCTFIIVSHNMNTIKKMCQRVIWIHDGVIKMQGDPALVTKEYLKYCDEHQNETPLNWQRSVPEKKAKKKK